MALVSPGVQVTVTDQSQYLPGPTNSIPLIVFATAQNKSDPAGVTVAPATTAANAGKLFQVTSQRDLVSLYGVPFFYTTSNGTPIQGYELNEYGLLAAYSALGITNRVYCLRADIDLSSLVGKVGRPTGNPANGTYWLDTTTSTWGIYEFDAVTGTFILVTPIVITDSTLLSGNVPNSSVGNIGDYAVVAIPSYNYPSSSTAKTYFYKDPTNIWVSLGSTAWLNSYPTVAGTESNPTLSSGDTLTISLSGGASATITLASASVADLANQINALGYGSLSAVVSSGGTLQLFSSQVILTPVANLAISGTGTVLTDLGITAGTYYQPSLFYGTSAQQPLWQAGQQKPRPSGSVWIKVGSAGTGLYSEISEWNNATAIWVPKTANIGNSDWDVTSALDSTGGQAIPVGTIYTQYTYDGQYNKGGLYYYERIATGPTVIVGDTTDPVFSAGPYTYNVYVSIPGSGTISSAYPVTLADNATATEFVTSWTAANIPYTTASITDTGSLVLTHTQGGTIVIDDYTNSGVSSGLATTAGFVSGTTLGVKEGPFTAKNAFTPAQGSTSGVGTGFSPNVTNNYQQYIVNPTAFSNAGSGYAVGDTITILGTALGGATTSNDLVVVVTSVSGGGVVTAVTYVSGTGAPNYATQLSNWYEFTLTAQAGAIVATPLNNTNWFYSVVNQVDIMMNTTGGWKGYRNVCYDSNGFPLPSGTPSTDPNGPIVSASEPTTQSDGTALVYGDIWIDTSDLENYPIINRWQSVNGIDSWVTIDNTNQTASNGIVFADARWATNGTTSPTNDPIPSIKSLLTSNYLDLDAPANTLYPVGMLLFNTRRSGYNVKQFKVNYFNNNSFPGETLPEYTDAWVSESGLMGDGAPYMGRQAQRNMVVKSLRSVIDTNTDIRDEDNPYNLIATPNYPELQPNMVVLNNDRGNTGYILGDTPMRLPATATAIQSWATNAAGAETTGEQGLVTRDTYLGLFYPSGLTTDLSGNLVAVPPSHMTIRTFLRNDAIAYPWLAAAGSRRGLIHNDTNIGYIDSTTGEFITVKPNIGVRDVEYTNQINPLVFFTGNGLLNFGNKNSFNSQSALDRTNVARLIAYIRRQLALVARPFIFEPNDSITRQQISAVIQTLFIDLVAKRGIYDYLVVCDESNNTPARIDRNELWVDIAIEPVKAVEFIYIPVRVLNTGGIAALLNG